MMLSKSHIGAAITQVTEAAQHCTIAIPAQKGGVLKYVELAYETVLETVVVAGGLVRLWNTSADWDPFYALTPLGTVTTLGGGHGHPMRYYVEKELPGNSTVYANYTPYDNQSQSLELTIFWELGAKITEEHFIGYIHPLKAAGVAAVARASPGAYAIPGGKGGELVALYDASWPAQEAVVCSGGLRELECDAYDITPCQRYTGGWSVVGAGGGDFMAHPDVEPYRFKVPSNSTFTSYFTPVDDQNQTLSTLIHWKRPVRHRVVN